MRFRIFQDMEDHCMDSYRLYITKVNNCMTYEGKDYYECIDDPDLQVNDDDNTPLIYTTP